MTTLRKSIWNTYRITCYTHGVANDQASAGGVHLHQVRHTKSGWQYRIKQSNCGSVAYGAVEPLSEADGEAHFATAQQR